MVPDSAEVFSIDYVVPRRLSRGFATSVMVLTEQRASAHTSAKGTTAGVREVKIRSACEIWYVVCFVCSVLDYYTIGIKMGIEMGM